MSVIPGATLTISLATVGTMNGIVPGTIQLLRNETTQVEQLFFDTFAIVCSIISIAVRKSLLKSNTLYALQYTSHDQLSPTKILNVTFQECPPGFAVSPAQVCDCNKFIKQHVSNISCNASSLTFHRSETIWIGFEKIKNQTSIAIGGCPYDYCIKQDVNFTLSDPDPQCAYNRSGTLCGACKANYSLIFGSNECKLCHDNSYIALVLPFAVAGFGLVALLMVLNLTVSTGTINGLIFYANVVQTSTNVFSPESPVPVLSQFISWINLDLGIETCFYNGMTAYGKVGLQFVFPVYIWLVMAIIIVLCRYSVRLSKKIGRNVIQVLATLILFSYTKLFYTAAVALKFINLSFEYGNVVSRVWFIDGTVDYLSSWQHIILFTTAVLFLLLCLPFTVALLTNTLIEKYLTQFHLINRRWLNFKPLFDAYNGPYKDECRFWTGMLLLVRLILVTLVSSDIPDTVVIVYITTCSVILLSLMVYFNGIYQTKCLDLLECWSLLSLALLCSLTTSYKLMVFMFLLV